MVAIKDRIGLCAFCGDISHLYADCPDRYPNKGPKKILPRNEGQGSAASHSTRRDSPEPPTYYGVCSFCGLVGHGHELCPELKRTVREQADQIARIQMAKYEEVRNRAQEPTSRTKKLVRNLQDKAGVAKEDQRDTVQHTVPVEVARDQTGMVTEIPSIKIGIAVQSQEVMDSLLARDGVEEDLPKTRTRKMMMGYLEVSGTTRSPGLSRTPGTGGTKGAPRTDGTQGSTRGTIFHWFGGHAPTIPKCEYNSSGKFIAVCRGIPISAECKPKYGRPPKFNSGSARRADACANQVG